MAQNKSVLNIVESKAEVAFFVEELSQTKGWSNLPTLSLDAYPWSHDFKLTNSNARFFHITELSEAEEAALRQDLENVIACLDNTDFSWVYYISGTPTGIELYLGVVSKKAGTSVHEYSQLLASQLEGNFSGIKLNMVSGEDLEPRILQPLQESHYFGLLHGVPSRSLDEQSPMGTPVTQGIDRLARGLSGQVWQLLLVAEPAETVEVNQQIDDLLQLSSDLHPYIKQSRQTGSNESTNNSDTTGSSDSYGLTESSGSNSSENTSFGTSTTKTVQKGKNSGGSVGKSDNGRSSSTSKDSSWGDSYSESKADGGTYNFSNTIGKNEGKSVSHNQTTNSSRTEGTSRGTSTADTVEYINKKIERVQEYINEKLIERFDLGRSKGMFRTAVYLAAPNKTDYERLSHAMVSVFQGNQSHFTPLQVSPFSIEKELTDNLFQVQHLPQAPHSNQLALIHSIPNQQQSFSASTWLNSSELSILAGLPSKEVAGLILRKNVDFAVNPVPVSEEDGFELGVVIQNGRRLNNNKVRLSKYLLNQHIFISGTTGSGKTTTCQQILLKSGLPFLVIEPAKTEYRSLSVNHSDIEYYTLGNEEVSPFRFNPFELLPNESVSGHIDMLKATFAATFPMEASMPYLIEEAVVKSYEAKGWDIHYNKNLFYEDPWSSNGAAFPILSEMLELLKEVIKSKNFGMDLQQKYEGSLISRLDNLTTGAKGRMLNTRNSIDINDILDKRVVIELDDLRDEQDKCLMVGFLVGRVAEAIKQRRKNDHSYQHLTLLEEAHRLLSKPDSHEGAKRAGVEFFANLLAEVRKYGEGLIIADQIPNKLTPEVLKNTNTKIIHRLFAADDRHAIGDTVGLSDEQKDFLPMLLDGETIIYSAGWHEAVRVQIAKPEISTNAAEIDIAVIKKLGQTRIYQQRARLYPHLTQAFDWNKFSPEEFSWHIQEQASLLNLLTRWVCEPSPFLHKLLLKQANLLQNELPGGLLKTTLPALFLDIAPVNNEQVLKGYQLTPSDFIAICAEQLLDGSFPENHESGSNYYIDGANLRSDNRSLIDWAKLEAMFKSLGSI